MAFLAQFLIMLLAAGFSLGQDNPCPPREGIRPCSCHRGVYGTEVICKKVDSVEKVREILQKLKEIRGLSVKFDSCSLGWVPSDLFKGLHIKRLTFQHCTLQGIGNEGRSALEGLEDILEYFKVEFTLSSDGLRFPNVSQLHKLERLDVESSNVKELGNEWFAEGPANLKELHISGNNLERLGEKAFAKLTNLQRLGLSHNRVTTPLRSMFPSPAVHLQALFITDNDISSLPVDFFSDMPALKSVYVARNSLQSIPEATWATVWSQLFILDIESNPLECDSEIDWTFKQRLPDILRATCASPKEEEGVDLKIIIKDKQREK